VQRLQAFSASWRVAPPDTRPTLFHAGGAFGVFPSEVFPPTRPIEPLGRSAPPDVVLQVGRSASSPVVVRKRATSLLEVTLSVRRRSGAFRRQKLRTGNAVPALGCSAQLLRAPCGTCGGRATSPAANARVRPDDTFVTPSVVRLAGKPTSLPTDDPVRRPRYWTLERRARLAFIDDGLTA
jgi:hypothetical protein